jgi:predicted ferric reductase/Ca2+-binding EF-hand superfamily protein
VTERDAPPGADARLLSRLERAFAEHAGTDERIDAAEFQRAVGLRSEYLSRRVFALFDADRDGFVDRAEFVATARRLVSGDVGERLAFAFRLHDHDGDGLIARDEMLRMIAMGMAESEISERATQPAEHLTDALFRAVDANRDGRISFDEFTAAVLARPALLHRLTASEATWLAPNEDLLERLDDGPAQRRLGAFVEQGLAGLVLVALWLAVNVALFVVPVARSAPPGVRFWMELGRTLGVLLDFNGALILLPMLRRLLTRVRASALGRVLPVDDAVAFHRLVGHTLFALACAHAAAFTIAYVGGHTRSAPFELFFTSRGASGALLLAVFAVMWVCALDFVRRSRRFELFYFTHLLYVAWLVLAVVHAPSFFLWVGVPLAAFALEQALRLRRRGSRQRVLASEPLRSSVTKLVVERPRRFDFSPADYVFLRIPAVARHEWHPFTLSSAPERAELVVHVRALGNWTRKLREVVEARPGAPLDVYVEGPYGSPSAPIFASRVAVLVGGGIGVTPFASVLESIVLRANGASARESRLEKAYFFWLNRDQYSFEWFVELLAALERIDTRGLLDVHLCMTGARSGGTAVGLELARDVLHASGRSDMITGLRTHTHVGRPDWDRLLGEVAQRHGAAAVDLFFCGPAGLGKTIERVCRRLGVRFHEERF